MQKSFDVMLDAVLHIYIYLNACISLSVTVSVHLANGFICAMANPICFDKDFRVGFSTFK